MTDTDKELLPCPFCGTPASWRSDTWGKKERHWIGCPNKACEVGHKQDDKATAAMFWNRRATIAKESA